MSVLKLELTSSVTFDPLIHILLRTLGFVLFLYLNPLPILLFLSPPSPLLAPVDPFDRRQQIRRMREPESAVLGKQSAGCVNGDLCFEARVLAALALRRAGL